MEYKDIEEKLQNAASKIKKPEFSEIWEEIKDEINVSDVAEIKRKRTRKRLKKFLPAAATTVGIVSAAAVIISVMTHKPQKEIYFMDQLGAVSVTESEFYEDLEESQIKHVDFSGFIIQSYTLLKTNSLVTKGGLIEVYDDEDAATMFATIKFLDASVEIEEEKYSDYDLTYTVNNTEIKYKLKEYIEREGIATYTYGIFADSVDTRYMIDYNSLTDNVLTFMDTFFS